MEKKRAGRPLVLVFAAVILAILYSSWNAFSSDSQPSSSSNAEQQLAQVLQEIHSVGQVTVYFHYGQTEGEQALFSDYFRVASDERTITGVLIVAEGASTAKVKQLLRDSVSSVMQLPHHRIVIVPMQIKEDKK